MIRIIIDIVSKTRVDLESSFFFNFGFDLNVQPFIQKQIFRFIESSKHQFFALVKVFPFSLSQLQQQTNDLIQFAKVFLMTLNQWVIVFFPDSKKNLFIVISNSKQRSLCYVSKLNVV